MLIRTHIAIAFLFLFFFFNQIENKVIFIIFFLLATFFPDIDTSSSKLGNHIIFRPLQWIISHRGLFHSFIFLSFASALIYLINNSAGVAFFTGYLLHLLTDALTPNGVKILWPLTNFKIKFIIKSGSIIEEIIFVLILLIDIFLFIKILFNI